MPNPKRKLAKSWRGNRRSHHALKAPSFSRCPRCNQDKLPHRVCGNCGYYGKTPVISFN